MGAFSGPETVDDGIVLALDAVPNPRFSNYKGRSVAFVKSNDDGFNVSNSTGWFNPNNTSQWTLEGWILNPSSTNKFAIYSGTNGAVANFGCSIGGSVAFQSGNGAWAWVTNSTIVADTGSPTGWNHFAFTKNGSTFEVFLNGSRIYTGTPTFGTGGTGGSIHLQSYFSDGNYYNDAAGLSNVRYVTGSVLYSGTSYTVPTEPLTAISGTQLLVYQDTTFTDASSNGLTLTVQNSPTISYNGPFSGSGWTDLTNNGNSGTLTNGPVFTQEPKQEPFGGAGAVQFDGNGDYLEVPKSTDFDFGGAFTMEAWVYADSLTTDSYGFSALDSIFESIDWNSQLGQYSFGISHENKLYFYIFDSSNIFYYGTTVLSTQQWYHLAVSRDSSDNIRLFVNGALESTNNNSYSLSNSNQPNPARIGGCKINNSGSGIQKSFDGYISNLHVIKGTALYTSNFTPKRQSILPESAPNTVLLTCQKGTIRDRSPSAHAITVNGDAKSISGVSYFEFDGTNDYIDLGDTFDDIIAGADKKFSMEIWINPDTVSESHQHLISKHGDSNFSENTREFYIKLSNDEVSSFASFNPSTAQSRQYTTSSANLTAGSWHHIVLVYDGSIDAAGRFTFYVNGQNEAATETYSNGSWGDIQDTAARFAIGAMVGANVANSPLAPYNGKVSNAKVYSRLLTAAEVKQNYRNTKGRYGL